MYRIYELPAHRHFLLLTQETRTHSPTHTWSYSSIHAPHEWLNVEVLSRWWTGANLGREYPVPDYEASGFYYGYCIHYRGSDKGTIWQKPS